MLLLTGNFLFTINFLTDFVFRFVDDTPLVRDNTVTFNLTFGSVVQSARCGIVRNGQTEEELVDCKC